MQVGRRPRRWIEPRAEAGAGADPAGRGSWPVLRGRAALIWLRFDLILERESVGGEAREERK